MGELGKRAAVIKTVFAYKINVAIAVILLFLNIQALVSMLAATDAAPPILASIGLTAASMAYGLLAINGYLTKIFVHEGGFVMKGLFRERIINETDIKKAAFHRITLKKIIISVTLADDAIIKINSTKYNDIEPLIKYLQKFKAAD